MRTELAGGREVTGNLVVNRMIKMSSVIFVLTAICLTGTSVEASKTITLDSGGYKLKGTLCLPKGVGPFAAVLYHHGGMGTQIGGAPKATCNALAKAGFVGFSLIRRSTRSLQGHLEDAEAAVNYIKKRADVDPDRIGLIGFSRGGLLAWQQAAQRIDLSAVVIMAVAVNRRLNIADAPGMNAPFLVLVAQNDTGSRLTKGSNTLDFSRQLVDALEKADRDVQLLIYPPFRKDGHTLFFEVRSEYWPDVIEFLKQKMLAW